MGQETKRPLNSMKEFKISDNRGYAYSIESGDKNKIHLDNLTGYNSIFNHKIIYGTLIFFEVLKELDFKKLNQYSINIQFINAFKYNEPIKYKKTKIYQKNFGLAYVHFSKKTEYQFNNEKLKLIKTFNLNNFNSSKKFISVDKKIRVILNHLSWYVGMVNPGKYSLINNINLVHNSNILKSKKLKIYSKKIPKFPLIKNRITFDNFIVEFTTAIRPHLKKTNIKISKQVKKLALCTKIPILILGASSGIGKEIFDIYKNNKNINIISTYNKNRFVCNKKNIETFKLNIKNIEKKIKFIFHQYRKLRIYYFLSPKILYTNNNHYKIKEYNNFYIKIPQKIISLVPKNLNLEFFYPSTILINKKENNDYTKSKIIAEKILTKLNKNNIKINVLRIDGINTKQNLSFLNQKNPSFIEKLNTNNKYKKEVFFL